MSLLYHPWLYKFSSFDVLCVPGRYMGIVTILYSDAQLFIFVFAIEIDSHDRDYLSLQ